jgi:hypothetical protein
MEDKSLQCESLRSSYETDETLFDETMAEKHTPQCAGDLESQPILNPPNTRASLPQLAVEYRIPARRKLTYLGGYFLLNLSLTLYNKALLGNVKACR